MRSFVLGSLFCIMSIVVSSLPLDESVALEKRAISPALYDDLVFYFKYAAATNFETVGECPKPNGKQLITRISDAPTDTQGLITLDDNKREIVISLRAATSLGDFIIDADFGQTPFNAPGVSAPPGATVHSGFLRAWNSVAAFVIQTVKDQLASHPSYSVVTTGHSLGGALSSLAGMTLKANFPNVPIRMFTYGQPRTGNSVYANWVNQQFGLGKHFRAVHTTDPIPHLPPRFLGYLHHGVEYWSWVELLQSAATTRQCAPAIEDPTCSASLPLLVTAVTPAHLTYFNIPAAFPFCS